MIFKISRNTRIQDAQRLTLFRSRPLFSWQGVAIHITKIIPCLLLQVSVHLKLGPAPVCNLTPRSRISEIETLLRTLLSLLKLLLVYISYSIYLLLFFFFLLFLCHSLAPSTQKRVHFCLRLSILWLQADVDDWWIIKAVGVSSMGWYTALRAAFFQNFHLLDVDSCDYISSKLLKTQSWDQKCRAIFILCIWRKEEWGRPDVVVVMFNTRVTDWNISHCFRAFIPPHRVQAASFKHLNMGSFENHAADATYEVLMLKFRGNGNILARMRIMSVMSLLFALCEQSL